MPACRYCTAPATHRIRLRSALGEFALVAVIPLALSSALVCAFHASKPEKLYYPGGAEYGGWVFDGTVEQLTATS